MADQFHYKIIVRHHENVVEYLKALVIRGLYILDIMLWFQVGPLQPKFCTNSRFRGASPLVHLIKGVKVAF